ERTRRRRAHPVIEEQAAEGMSYDISLWDRGFLQRAIEQNLGDWRNGDPIPRNAVDSLIERAVAAGFVHAPEIPSFIKFMRGRGLIAADRYVADDGSLLAELHLHDGQLAFTVPYGPLAEVSIHTCVTIARAVALEHGLGYQDPQVGEIWWDPPR